MYSCIYCGWPVNNKPGQVCNSKSCGDKEMIKYPKTRQFKDCVFQVRKDSEYHGKPIPKLTFNGTVKLHGSNSSVVFNGGDIEFQSRNRIITPEDDNLGFAKFAEEIHWNEFFYTLLGDHNRYSKAVVYGEWCGEGIQSGIAISKAPKMFVIFAIKISDEWVPLDSVRRADVDSRVKWIDDFPTYTTIIDFNEVESAINSLVDITAQVEESCPVGRQLGFEGIGEGVVWVCESNLDLRFKVKGEKHSNSKVKKLNPVDAERIERLKTLSSNLLTEERLQQGFDYLAEMNLELDRKNLGTFIKHVVSDCIDEEKLTIEESEFEAKEIGKQLSFIAKTRFFEKEQGLLLK